MATFAAIFAYAIIPDSSFAANAQKPEIPLKSAGYKVKVFTLDNNAKSNLASYFMGHSAAVQIAYDSVSSDGVNLLFHTPIGVQKVLKLPDGANSSTYVSEHTEIESFYLGTDKYGRDVLSRLILGIRISLIAGFVAVLVSLLIGIVLGAISGYYRGWIDQIVMYAINVTWSIPTVLLVFAIVLALGRSMTVIFFAIGITMWVDVARLVRGQVMATKEEQFVLSAKSIGQHQFTILWKHILPNIIGPILVIVSANFASAILIEAGLSYLGFGVNPPTPSLGNILNENYGYALSGHILLSLAPAVIVMILVLSFNMIGSGLRDMYGE